MPVGSTILLGNMTTDEIIKTIELYKNNRLARGAILDDICDEIDNLVGEKIEEWLSE